MYKCLYYDNKINSVYLRSANFASCMLTIAKFHQNISGDQMRDKKNICDSFEVRERLELENSICIADEKLINDSN